MDKRLIGSAVGTILGSLVEEGLEEVFPGLGELGAGGEVVGGLVGLIIGGLKTDEGKASVNRFLRYAFKEVNGHQMDEGATKEEVDAFVAGFKAMPPKAKSRIISSYKSADPQGFAFIGELLSQD